MKGIQIVNAVQQLCTMIETEIIGQEGACVDCGAILTGDNIDDYSIESVSRAVDKEQIAISVRFHAIASNTWHGRFYFRDMATSSEENSESPKTNAVGMTDMEIMHHRFSHKNFRKHTGLLAEMLGMSRKDYEDAVKRGMEQEARERENREPKMNRRKRRNSMEQTVLKIETEVVVTQEDIDDIMCGALEGGISYWCSKAEVEGEYLGEYASEQISRGGSLKLYDREAPGAVYILTKGMFLSGLRMYLENPHPYDITEGNRDGYKLDTCQADAVVCDMIIQYAVFGEQIYG